MDHPPGSFALHNVKDMYNTTKLHEIREANRGKPCRVIDCDRTREGVTTLCAFHDRAVFWYGTPYAPGGLHHKDLDTGRVAAHKWVRKNKDNAVLLQVLDRLDHKMRMAPEPLPFVKWKGRPTPWKAERIWGHFRPGGLEPERLVRSWIAVTHAFLRPTQPIHHKVYHRRMIAQLLRKGLTGTWPSVKTKKFITLRTTGEPGCFDWVDHRQQQFGGNFSSALGEGIHQICEPLLDEIPSLKRHHERFDWLYQMPPRKKRGRKPRGT